MTPEELKEFLDLRPLPKEGGFFKEVFRSSQIYPQNALPARYVSQKSAITSIFYMLEATTFSAFHRLKSDEIYHFYLGDPVDLVLLDPDGSMLKVTLGQDILAGHHLQYAVPGGVWQASRLLPGGSLALMGCTVAPGFDFDDYEHGEWESLVRQFPSHHATIMNLTRR
ncbi:MAG: cupin domain-containing protein [Cyanobacteria bacterium SZAS-4]|nr:cupin domain-containing protein [Cyanobacteria bacterium SZAS-4]